MKKNENRGFFLSETMIVMTVVAIVILGIFKVFSPTYSRFKENENYNTVNAVTAISAIRQYYDSITFNAETVLNGNYYVELTNNDIFNSDHYTNLKNNLSINKIYLFDMDKLFQGNNINNFDVTLRKYLKTINNNENYMYAIVVVLNEKQYASSTINSLGALTLVGDENDEYVTYVTLGGNFVDPGYTGWSGSAPTITGYVDTNRVGRYYLYYDFNGYKFRRKVIVEENKYRFAYNGSYHTFTVPETGWYQIELWGGKGGGEATYAGKGAYTSGKIQLTMGENIYIYIGGAGGSADTTTNTGGYNGGGYSGNNSSAHSYGGGGSTDVRINSGAWNNETSLNSRIMVAAGGGGNASLLTTKAPDGGALFGIIGTSSVAKYNTATYLPTGATQIKYGVGKSNTGYFGYSIQSYLSGYGGGGGSGYYAGAKGYGTTGSSGSSYISGYAGVVSIDTCTSCAQLRTHSTNTTRHYSNKYFIDGKMEPGANSSNNGYAIVSYLGTEKPKRVNTKLNNVRYIKDCINGNYTDSTNRWVELQAIKDGVNIAKGKTVTGITNDPSYPISRITDGDITSTIYANAPNGQQCIIIDLSTIEILKYDLDEIAVWHDWSEGEIFNNHIIYTSETGADGSWSPIIATTEVETGEGKRVSAYDDGLLIHYDGIDNTGSGVHNSNASSWTNLANSAYDGVLMGGATWGDNYLSFDGIDDWVSVGLLNKANLTVEVIVEHNNVSTLQYNVGTAQTGGFYFISSADRNCIGVYVNGIYNELYGTSTHTIGEKYSLSFTFDNSQTKIYKNGQLDGSLSVAGVMGLPKYDTIMILGANPKGLVATDGYFDGKMYSVRIYDRALTATEIANNYQIDSERYGL